MNVIKKVHIAKLNFPVEGYRWNVVILTSTDGGRTFWYAGNGKYAKSFPAAIREKFKLLRSCRKNGYKIRLI